MARNNMLRYAAVAAVAAGLATFAPDASAQLSTNTTGNVSVTVDNTISITETTAMNFGTTAAVADAGNTATYVLDVAGSPSTTAAGAAVFYRDTTSTPTQGVFAVEGPNGATLTVTVPGSGVTVDCTTGPDFTLNTFDDDTVGGTVTGLGTGTPIVVNVGATLNTDSTVGATTAYDNGTCSGTYTMTVGF